ncbi:reverse transcriptase [Mycena venus]|uniref:Reverse transcriptase n=1 Tax=Mycena venus TaxID=2733690 RepID=A0A8H7DEB8_9AGAR|nr:reverse transcriptase [Mycena venus]
MAKRWWKPLLTTLRSSMRNKRRTFQRTRVSTAKQAWLDARRAFYRAISQAKHDVWMTNGGPRSSPSICDPESGDVALSHLDRGRVLGRAWFGSLATDVTEPTLSPDVTPAPSADDVGCGARNMRGGVRSEASPPSGLPPSADRQDHLPASTVTSEAPVHHADLLLHAETIAIPEERPFTPPADSEIDAVILSSPPWKAPDRYGVQMGHIQRGYVVLRDWIRVIFRASATLGAKPTPYKSNIATPVHKAGKKDKTSPKAWRPVENFEHILAKPLERLIADRISFEAERYGFLEESQFGGRPGRSTLQAADGYIHRVRMQLDAGNTVSTLFYDLKGAFNRVSHQVVIREMANLGYSRQLIRWVASFLHHHLVTVVIDGVRTATFRCCDEGAPQGSALSVIVFLISINRLLRSLKTIGVFISWTYGFVDDTNFSTASKSAVQNVSVLNKAACLATEWARVDGATFENTKTELIHHSPGRSDLSEYCVTFDGVTIRPSELVKWIGVLLDSKLTGEAHIKARAASAVRALNAALALTHAVWGLKPVMVRDLARAVVLPRADYGVTCFFPLPSAALKPLERVNKCVARCITGGFRTASLTALEKEAAILPAPLRLERALLHRISQYLTLPPHHGVVPLIQDAILHTPKHYHRASALHYVERLPMVRWPPKVPPRGSRIRGRKTSPPTDVTTDPRADQDGSGACGKRGGAVTGSLTQGLSPPPGGRQVTVTVPPVASDALDSQFDFTLGMEPILPVYAAPWAPPLPVATVIPPKQSAVSVLNDFLADDDYARATWYTDGSLLAGSAGGAAVWVVKGRVQARILIPLGKGQVAEGEIEGILKATERALSEGADHILIVSDSQVGLKAILTTHPRAGQFRAIQYDQMVRSAMRRCPSLRITNLWTPAHIGTTGNELADDAAKAATLLPPTALVSSTGRGLREIDNSPPSVILRSPYDSFASRADISLICQLRTDFSQLNAHRFRCRLTQSPACDACGTAFETRIHYLLHCPAYEPLRPPLQAASYKADILGAVDVRSLLSHPKLLKALITFINLSRRFK